MVVGIGIDIIEIDRIEQSIQRFGDQFLNKIFTPNEIAYCNSKAIPAQHYAARFAAKEAVYKAFSETEQVFLSWQNIEVFTDERGKPQINLIVDKEKCDISKYQLHISLSHSRNYAVCSVTLSSL